MKYELAVMAALTKLEHPNTRSIVEATGISERKVQQVLQILQQDLEVKINRIRNGKVSYFEVISWGIFESGQAINCKLSEVDLVKFKYSRQHEKDIRNQKNKRTIMTSYNEKKHYFDRVKLKNYRDSMRLEGMSVVMNSLPETQKEQENLRDQLIRKYSV
ncbi:YhfG family protein [Photorhabdus temperata]|nr:YhfG family protein [Photorhabdus temperata]MCT8345927.1 YhfG family protein [Photorhabdus temperata]